MTEERIPVLLTPNEINRIAQLLKDSAQAKKKRAREVHVNDRQNMIDAAMSDYELRKVFVGAKAKS